VTQASVAGFRDRARFEAERYGGDPWVFVRELLQNARDAGAGEVELEVEVTAETERISCRDDGEGMSYEQARRFLFRLYSSSKGEQANVAGRFGVGFWSILRFAPTLIVVRSFLVPGRGWELELSGDLESASWREIEMRPGTEVVLERCRSQSAVAEEVFRAAQRDAGFLRRRDEADHPVKVTVDGRLVNQVMSLPAPSLIFRRSGLQGVVALAETPRVEVYAKGLRIREAAFLDDLVLARMTHRKPRNSPALPNGLLPRFILDSDRLDVLMSRGDAREDRTMRRMVSVARRELDSLVRRQLDRAQPASWATATWERLRWIARNNKARAVMIAVCAGASVAALVLLSAPQAQHLWRAARPTIEGDRLAQHSGPGASSASPLYDLKSRYRGPAIDPLIGAPTPIDLTYQPKSLSPLFAAARIVGLDSEGRWFDPESYDSGAEEELACGDSCVAVRLQFAADTGQLRVPVPTGYAIVSNEVRLDGEMRSVALTAAGEVALDPPLPARGLLEYRCTPVRMRTTPGLGLWPPLTAELDAEIRSIRGLPVAQRVARSLRLVQERVAYDRSSGAIARQQRSMGTHQGFFEGVLRSGSGDCDVQNALLAAVLTASGVPARLAIGYLGEGGIVMPGVHAWVEYLDAADGLWQVADASGTSLGETNDVSASRCSAPTFAADIPTTGRRLSWLGLVSVVLLFIVVAWLFSRRGLRRTYSDQDDLDLAALLRGAILQPDAYSSVAAVKARRVVPLINGQAISLERAQALAERGSLYQSRTRSPLAQRTARGRGVVIDARRPEGEAVAEILGGPDLDLWDRLLDGSFSTPPSQTVEATCARLGRACTVTVCPRAKHEVSSLQLDGRRVIAVAQDGALFRRVEAAAVQSSRLAALVLADGVAGHLGLNARQRRQALASLAGHALPEVARGK
jgi:hypothetical protein